MAEARCLLVLAALAGHLALAVTGAVAATAAAAAALLVVVAAAATALTSPGSVGLLRGVSVGVLPLGGLLVMSLEVPRFEVLAGWLLVLSVAVALRWSTPADLRAGIVVATSQLGVAAVRASDPAHVLPLVVGWVAVLLVGLRLPVLRLRAEPAVTRAPAGSGRRPGPVPLAAAALTVALALALTAVAALLVPVPTTTGSLPGADAQAAREQAGQKLSRYTSPVMDMSRRQDERAGGAQPVLEVPAGSPALWRSTVYDTYDGRSWSASRPDLEGHDGEPYTGSSTQERGDVVTTTAHDGTVWAPGAVRWVVPFGRAAVLTDRDGAVRLTEPVPAYEVAYDLPPQGLAAVPAGVGTDVDDPRWLQLPDTVPERVLSLGRELTAGAAGRVEAVETVVRYVNGRATYRLDAPVPGRGEDAVDRFLFVDRVGFCQQFAAATAVLLRAAGIPARVVTGLGYADADGLTRTYTTDDLHAWTEVHVPGAGWVPVDATPAASGAAPADAVGGGASALLDDVRGRIDDLPGGRTGAALALLVAGVLAVWARRRLAPVLRRRAQRPAPPAPLSARPGLAAFLRFDARLGALGRRRAESLTELRQRLAPPGEVADALAVVERECYAPAPPAEVAEAAEVLDATDAGAVAVSGRTTVLPVQGR